MTRIKYLKDVKDSNFEPGDFVSIPDSDGIIPTNFAIIVNVVAGKFTVIDLFDGSNYLNFPSIESLVDELHPQHITRPFVIDPESGENNDKA